MKFTIFSGIYAKRLKRYQSLEGLAHGIAHVGPPHLTVDLDLAIQTEREAIRLQFPVSRVRKS